MFTVALLAILFATALGFGMGRAGLCLVSATHDLVYQGDSSALRLQALAVGVTALLFAGELALGLHAMPLPSGGSATGFVVAGAALLAVGYIINGGCYLGSVSFLGQGKLQYCFTLVGIYLAELFSAPRRLMLSGHETLVPQMSFPLSAMAAAGIALLAWVALGRLAKTTVRQRRSGVIIASISAVLMFSILPGWSYGATLAGIARMGPLALGLPHLAGLTLFAGAITANVIAGQWHPAPPGLIASLRCLVGGYIMQTGSQIVPGGSDSWVFWTIPGGGLHGLIAYAVTLPMLLAWWGLSRRFG